MKTMQEWEESGKSFGDFAAIGEEVDEEIYDYFLDVLPPACLTGRLLQIGEPAAHREDENGNLRPIFATFERIKVYDDPEKPNGRIAIYYRGECYLGQTTDKRGR